MPQKLKHGSVWLANLDPGRGTEPGKVRPVLLLQNQALLDAGHPSTLIIPLTTNLMADAEPLRIRIKAGEGLDKESDLLIDQIRAIDNKRLVAGPLLQLEDDLLQDVYKTVKEVAGIN